MDSTQLSVLGVYLKYLGRALPRYLLTLLVSFITVWLDPTSTILTCLMWPIVMLGLAVVMVGYYVSKLLVLDAFIMIVTHGGSIIGLNSELILPEEATERITAAKAALGTINSGPREPVLDAPGATGAADSAPVEGPFFNIDSAKALLVMSALLYERKEPRQVEAALRLRRDPSTSLDEGRNKTWSEMMVAASEEPIKRMVEGWGLEYQRISDHAAGDGPFASAFYSPKSDPKPFIVLAFKGTSPTCFSEFIIDASVSRVSVNAVVSPNSREPFFPVGSVHEGFYSELFPERFHSLTNKINEIAATLSQDGKPVPLFITGHSLGAALAALLFARYLYAPGDLSSNVQLRDAYTFGTPRFGDGTFALSFEETPKGCANALWRVVNHEDVVCMIPPGVGEASDTLQRFKLAKILLNFLNFSHLGLQLRLDRTAHPFYVLESKSAARVIGSTTQPSAFASKQGSSDWGWWSLLSVPLGYIWYGIRGVWRYFKLPTLLHHLPALYSKYLDLVVAETPPATSI